MFSSAVMQKQPPRPLEAAAASSRPPHFFRLFYGSLLALLAMSPTPVMPAFVNSYSKLPNMISLQYHLFCRNALEQHSFFGCITLWFAASSAFLKSTSQIRTIVINAKKAHILPPSYTVNALLLNFCKFDQKNLAKMQTVL